MSKASKNALQRHLSKQARENNGLRQAPSAPRIGERAVEGAAFQPSPPLSPMFQAGAETSQQDLWCSLVETLSLFDSDIVPGSPEAWAAFTESRAKLQALWFATGVSGPTENAVGFSSAKSLSGERSLIAICFGRMVRCQGNGRNQATPQWMGRYWFNEGGAILSISKDEWFGR